MRMFENMAPRNLFLPKGANYQATEGDCISRIFMICYSSPDIIWVI